MASVPSGPGDLKRVTLEYKNKCLQAPEAVKVKKGSRIVFDGPPNAEILVAFKEPAFFDVKEFKTGGAAVTVLQDLPHATEYDCFLLVGGQREANPPGCPKGGSIEPDTLTNPAGGN